MSETRQERNRPYHGWAWVWLDNAGMTWVCLGKKEPKVDKRGWTKDLAARRVAMWQGLKPDNNEDPIHRLVSWAAKAGRRPRLVKFQRVKEVD